MRFMEVRSSKKFRIFCRSQYLNFAMSQLSMLVLLLFLMFSIVKAQSSSNSVELLSQNSAPDLSPSLATVIGILFIMFSLTFILLAYAKFCRRRATATINPPNQDGLGRSRSRFSGIDKTVIESLPFFKFSSLRGSREGLDCAICLSKFEDIEILRLLPKCKHAFHIGCVDMWLEKHSSCPICRHNVSADDLALMTYSNSLRFLWNQQSELGEESNLELVVEREEDHQRGSSRFSIGSRSSSRKFNKGHKEEELPIQQDIDDDIHTKENEKVLHKFNHNIIVSDIVFKNRWSNLSSSDLIFLNSEMLTAISSNRFDSLDLNNEQSPTTRAVEGGQAMNIMKEEMERKITFESKFSKMKQTDTFPFSTLSMASQSNANSSDTSKFLSPNQKRSMSEITVHPRLKELAAKISSVDFGCNSQPKSPPAREERMRRLWLRIARKTVQWFAARDKRRPQPQGTRQSLNV